METDVFKKAGIHLIKISFQDKVRNPSPNLGPSYETHIRIVPGNIDLEKSEIKIRGIQSSGDAEIKTVDDCLMEGLVANNEDACYVDVILRDQYGNLIGRENPICGNGIIEAEEECDGGFDNGDGTGSCTPECKFNVCGDGYQKRTYDDDENLVISESHTTHDETGALIFTTELCDDGNTEPGDGCEPDCKPSLYTTTSGVDNINICAICSVDACEEAEGC